MAAAAAACVCVYVCVCARVHVCMCECVCVYAYGCIAFIHVCARGACDLPACVHTHPLWVGISMLCCSE